jgi:hypothetical protein
MDLETILSSVLSPHTSIEGRQIAHQHLEAFKQRPDALELCMELFTKESTGAKREALMHFALRSCIELLRLHGSQIAPHRIAALRQFVFQILHPSYLASSRLVENTAVLLVVELVKCDAQYLTLFDQLFAKLKSRVDEEWFYASRVLCELGELLSDEDAEEISNARRALVCKYLAANSCKQAWEYTLQHLEREVRALSNELALAQSIRLASELIKWTTFVANNAGELTRCLRLVEQCCAAVCPTRVVQAAFHCYLRLCEQARLPPDVVLALHRSIVSCLTNRAYRNENEFSLGNEVFSVFLDRHAKCLTEVRVPDWLAALETFTVQAKAQMSTLNDYLELWKNLLSRKTVVLTPVLLSQLAQLCIVSSGTVVDVEEEDAEEPQMKNLMRELIKQEPDVAVRALTSFLPSLNETQTLFVLECISIALTDKQLDAFAEQTGGALSASLASLLDCVVSAALTLPCTTHKLKMLHHVHTLYEKRSAYLSRALQYLVEQAVNEQHPQDIKKRAACNLLYLLRRVHKANNRSVFVLPQLVQRMSQQFHTLQGTERFVLLDCVLVAGKALPTEAERAELTRQVLSEPFSVLQELAPHMLQTGTALLATSPAPPQVAIPSWDARGYFADAHFLPDASRRFLFAFMALSTCAKDGQLTPAMWTQLAPLALATLRAVDDMREPWALIIHPVDARVLFGGKLADAMEGFLESLAAYGKDVLGLARMPIISLLSCLRTCALELVKELSHRALLTAEMEAQLFYTAPQIEHRHLAMLLAHVARVPNACLQHVSVRLQTPFPQQPHEWHVHVHPTCEREEAESAERAAISGLELAFVRVLAQREPPQEDALQWLSERLCSQDDHAVRLAAQALLDKYAPRFPAALLARITLPFCARAYATITDEPLRNFAIDVCADVTCRTVFGVGVKDYSHAPGMPHNQGKKKPAKKPPMDLQHLTLCFGAARVQAFIAELNTAGKSEKVFRSLVHDLMQQAHAASATTTAAKPPKDVKKKKRKKKGGNNNASLAAQPPWHGAQNAADLGVSKLFLDDDDL